MKLLPRSEYDFNFAANAYIRETECIGCTKCIQVCPVDAIVGSAKLMHTVLTHECTGCEHCIAACPVDCIEMQNTQDILTERFALAENRFTARIQRLSNDMPLIALSAEDKMKMEITAALQRVKMKKAK